MKPERMVDIQPTHVYEDLQNTAATEYAKTQPASGSAEALALKQAFVLGANTSLQYPGSAMHVLQAVIAGRRWGLTEKSHRRLVVRGRYKPEFTTMETIYDTELGDSPEAAAAGLPQWSPRPHPSREQA